VRANELKCRRKSNSTCDIFGTASDGSLLTATSNHRTKCHFTIGPQQANLFWTIHFSSIDCHRIDTQTSDIEIKLPSALRGICVKPYGRFFASLKPSLALTFHHLSNSTKWLDRT